MTAPVDLYKSRPFKSRNAEDFALNEILDLFISPSNDLVNPFEFENTVVKGRMGSGKTMYLRANYAYHLYTIVPSLLDNLPIILPVLIRLSDFQHIKEPEKIYRAIIIKIIEEIAQVSAKLADCESLAQIHRGMCTIPKHMLKRADHRYNETLQRITKLNAEEYTETVSQKLAATAGADYSFLRASIDCTREKLVEVRTKHQPGILDIVEVHERLLSPKEGKLLILIDEAGSLDKDFFRDEGAASLFETLMNQLRTCEFIRTKIAVYPNSFSDVLVETRYGDFVMLTENVEDDLTYASFRTKANSLIERYVETATGEKIHASTLFAMEPTNDSLEQLIYGSGGNMRRLVNLLDEAMKEAFQHHLGVGKVDREHALSALAKNSEKTEQLYPPMDRNFIEGIARICKKRGTFKFEFPNRAPLLYKFTSKSEEHNILMVTEVGSGRRTTKYAFDYAYCIHHDIPTHRMRHDDKVDKTRSKMSGQWISKIAKVADDYLEHLDKGEKLEGVVIWVKEPAAFIQGDNKQEYFLHYNDIVNADQGRKISLGTRIAFMPVARSNNSWAVAAEIL